MRGKHLPDRGRVQRAAERLQRVFLQRFLASAAREFEVAVQERRDVRQERLAPVRSRLHPVPVVLSLPPFLVVGPVIRGQKQVIPLARLHPVFGVGGDFRERPGSHRGAVAFRPGLKAVHGDDEHVLAAQMVIDVVVLAEKKAIHVGQPVRVAGPQTEQDLVFFLQG